LWGGDGKKKETAHAGLSIAKDSKLPKKFRSESLRVWETPSSWGEVEEGPKVLSIRGDRFKKRTTGKKVSDCLELGLGGAEDRDLGGIGGGLKKGSRGGGGLTEGSFRSLSPESLEPFELSKKDFEVLQVGRRTKLRPP